LRHIRPRLSKGRSGAGMTRRIVLSLLGVVRFASVGSKWNCCRYCFTTSSTPVAGFAVLAFSAPAGARRMPGQTHVGLARGRFCGTSVPMGVAIRHIAVPPVQARAPDGVDIRSPSSSATARISGTRGRASCQRGANSYHGTELDPIGPLTGVAPLTWTPSRYRELP
jgi:hypothetical protein